MVNGGNVVETSPGPSSAGHMGKISTLYGIDINLICNRYQPNMGKIST